MVRGPFLQDTTEGEFVLELEVLRAEEEYAMLCIPNNDVMPLCGKSNIKEG